MGYRLSYTIKENINAYYNSFKTVNKEINKGDITPFIFTYLNFIKESAINLKDGLLEKSNRLEAFSEQIKMLPDGDDAKFSALYYYLLQASLFSEIGISINELLKYLKISRPTLQKRLQSIDDNHLLIIEKRDHNKFYSLDLDRFIILSEDQ